MTNTNRADDQLTGEQRLKNKRRAFWKYLILAMVGFAIAGFFGGFFGAKFEQGNVHIAIPIAIFAAVMLALIWFTWDYFRRIDELDLMDNLWAHLIGQYVAGAVFMTWYFFGELGLTSYPSGLGIMLAMIFGTFTSYGFRKLGLR